MACALMCMPSFAKKTIDKWPDGMEINDWFRQNRPVDIQTLGKAYRVTDYGVVNDGTVCQEKGVVLLSFQKAPI